MFNLSLRSNLLNLIHSERIERIKLLLIVCIFMYKIILFYFITWCIYIKPSEPRFSLLACSIHSDNLKGKFSPHCQTNLPNQLTFSLSEFFASDKYLNIHSYDSPLTSGLQRCHRWTQRWGTSTCSESVICIPDSPFIVLTFTGLALKRNALSFFFFLIKKIL